jgi:hypothetical protein
VNPQGTAENLIAAHPGNGNATRHGVYSRAGRALSPRASMITDAVASVSYVGDVDELGAAEIGRLVALIEAMDHELEHGGLTRRGDARAMVKLRLQASRRLQDWLDRYAMTPRGRAEFLSSLAGGGLAAEIAKRRGEAPDSEHEAA